MVKSVINIFGSYHNVFFVGQLWDKVFKNGPSKICGRQPLKNFNWSILEYLDPFNSVIYCFIVAHEQIHDAK